MKNRDIYLKDPATWKLVNEGVAICLKKISIEENGEATVISYTSESNIFKGKTETFSVTRFLLELTQHIPPRESQYIRQYGLYAPRRRWS